MWKASDADLVAHSEWDAYAAAYEAMLANTSTAWAPWHVVPSDHKWVARCVVGCIVVDALKKLHLKYPEPSPERRARYAELAKQLLEEPRTAH
jgi:polyphosphate kinase 2 (PPK2 family)